MLERLPGFEHERFYLSSDRAPAAALRSLPVRWPQLAQRARAADLLHTHGDVTSALVLPLLWFRPTVMSTHGLSMLRRIRGRRRELFIAGLARVVDAERTVICASAAERDDLSAVLSDRRQAKLRVIHNAVDPPRALSQAERDAVRRELGVAQDAVLGLFAGQLDPNKAPLLAARAARRVHEAAAPFVLVVAGDGPQAPQLRALAGAAVRPVGHRSDMGRLLGAADVFVAPSEREGMSYALLEAMAQGLAVVAADGPGNPEALGDAGLVFPAGDEPALVAALNRMVADPQLRAALGRRAAARAADAFSVERFLRETGAVYRAAVSGSPPTSARSASGG